MVDPSVSGLSVSQRENKERHGENGIKHSLTETALTDHTVETIITIIAYSTQGIVSSQTGPTLPDLQSITNSSTVEISWVITGDSIGEIAASVVASYVLARLSCRLTLMFSFTLLALTTVIIPWCSDLHLMIFLFTVRGIGSGFITITANAAVIWLWGSKNGPYLQALHLSYALGSLFSPLVAEPFVKSSSMNTSLINLNNDNISSQQDYFPNTTSAHNNITGNTASRVYIAYIIYASWTFVCAVMFLISIVHSRDVWSSQKRFEQQQRQKEQQQVAQSSQANNVLGNDRQQHGEDSSPTNHTPWFYISRIGTILYIFLHGAVLSCLAGFLSLFVVRYLNWTAADGAVLTFVFWTTLSSGRGIAVLLTRFSSPTIIIIGGLVISSIVLLIFSLLENLSDSVVWVSIAFVGIGIGPLAPAGFSWFVQNESNFSSLMSALMCGSTAIGAAIDPLLLGYLFDYATPMWFCYLLTGQNILTLILFLVLCMLCRVFARKRRGYASLPGNVYGTNTICDR